MDRARNECDWTGKLWNWYESYWDEDGAGIGYVDWTDVVAVMDATLQVNPNSKASTWNEFSAAVAARWSGTPCQETTWTDQGSRFELDN